MYADYFGLAEIPFRITPDPCGGALSYPDRFTV